MVKMTEIKSNVSTRLYYATAYNSDQIDCVLKCLFEDTNCDFLIKTQPDGLCYLGTFSITSNTTYTLPTDTYEIHIGPNTIVENYTTYNLASEKWNNFGLWIVPNIDYDKECMAHCLFQYPDPFECTFALIDMDTSRCILGSFLAVGNSALNESVRASSVQGNINMDRLYRGFGEKTTGTRWAKYIYAEIDVAYEYECLIECNQDENCEYFVFKYQPFCWLGNFSTTVSTVSDTDSRYIYFRTNQDNYNLDILDLFQEDTRFQSHVWLGFVYEMYLDYSAHDCATRCYLSEHCHFYVLVGMTCCIGRFDAINELDDLPSTTNSSIMMLKDPYKYGRFVTFS